MKVFLCLGCGGLYYAGREHWVYGCEHALDLQTIERATAVGQEENLETMRILVSSGNPSCDLFLPLRPRRKGQAEAGSPGIQALLHAMHPQPQAARPAATSG